MVLILLSAELSNSAYYIVKVLQDDGQLQLLIILGLLLHCLH
jgi:hypothetical protein